MALAQVPNTKAKTKRCAVNQNCHKTTADIITNSSSSSSGPISVTSIKRNKQWQRVVTNDFRSFMLLKLIDVVYPVGDDFQYRVVFDERLQGVVEFFKKRECNMFKAAESRSQYLRLLADDVFEIQKELETKCERRMEQHQKLCTLTSLVLNDLKKH